MAKSQIRYFLGGANWDGENLYPEFIEKGIWRSGWGSEDDQYLHIIKEVKKGDRIAIKKGMGQTDSRIQIRALGIVKAVDLEEEYCTIYVDWIRTGMKRMVESRGCYKTIHGPYKNIGSTEEVNWIRRIFCL